MAEECDRDCYRGACKFLMDNDLEGEGLVVHGRVFAGTPKRWINHAWAELPNHVYDPHMGIVGIIEYQDKVTPEVDNKYTLEEALIKVTRNKHWGPW